MNVINKSKKQIDGIIIKSKKHYEGSNETYLQHMKIAFKISIELFSASIMAAFHAIIPAIFQTGASKKIIELYELLQSKKRINK